MWPKLCTSLSGLSASVMVEAFSLYCPQELMITVRLKEDATVEVILADSLPKAAALCQPMRLLDLADECSGRIEGNE